MEFGESSKFHCKHTVDENVNKKHHLTCDSHNF